MKELQSIRKLVKQRKVINKEIIRLAQELWPVGSVVSFQRGRADIFAEVVMHNRYCESVKVRNSRTGKEYWIDYWYLYDEGKFTHP